MNIGVLVVIKKLCGHVKPVVLLQPFGYCCYGQNGQIFLT